MGHGPAVKLGKDNAAAYKSKIGISMFIVYTLTYFGFVVINAVYPALMEKSLPRSDSGCSLRLLPDHLRFSTGGHLQPLLYSR